MKKIGLKDVFGSFKIFSIKFNFFMKFPTKVQLRFYATEQ
jgi:hypothetical protein